MCRGWLNRILECTLCDRQAFHNNETDDISLENTSEVPRSCELFDKNVEQNPHVNLRLSDRLSVSFYKVEEQETQARTFPGLFCGPRSCREGLQYFTLATRQS